MTVTSQSNIVIHHGNDLTTVFPFTFRITEPYMPVVSIQDTVTKIILEVLPSSAYSITGVSPNNQGGGNVTYNPGTGPLPTGQSLIIQRVVNFTQLLDLINQGGFFPETIEYALDLIVFQTQQLKEQIDRAIVVPPGDDGITIFPGAPGQVPTFNADGDLVPATITGTGNMNTAVYDPDGVLAYTALRIPVQPEAFGGIGDGVADDTASVLAAANFAVANDRPLLLTDTRTYKFSTLALAASLVITGTGALLSDGSLNTAEAVTLTLGANTVAENITFRTPGTETNIDFMVVGSGSRIQRLDCRSTAQRAGGGVRFVDPTNTVVGHFISDKIDRPFHFQNTDINFPATGAVVGVLEINNYVRGFRADFTTFTVGKAVMKVRSPNASKSPGHNGVLIAGCPGSYFGPHEIDDAGEHAFRIGGSLGNANIFPNPENVAGWSTLTGSTITSNAAIAPDGSLTADLIAKAGGVDNFTPGNNVTVTNVPHAFSTYLRYVSGSGWVRLRCSAPSNAIWVNVNTGVIGGVNPGFTSVTMTNVGNGYYRISGVITPTAGVALWSVVPVTADGVATPDTGSVDSWGTKLEIATAVSSYINRTEDLQIGEAIYRRPGGCGFKVNPTLQITPGITEKAKNVVHAGYVVIDGGDGSAAGNEEIARITHVDGLHVEYALARTDNETFSGQYVLQINDARRVTFGELGGTNLNAGFISVDGTSDVDGVATFGGDVIDLKIDRLVGSCSGNNAMAINTAFNVGDISIGLDMVQGFSVNLFLWVTGTVTDKIHIHGSVGGTVAPVTSGVPANDNFVFDVSHANFSGKGARGGALRMTAAHEIMSNAFDPASTTEPPRNFFANNSRITAGSGVLGGGLEASRMGSSRRAAAIVPRQGTADDKEVGWDFFVGDTNSTANEALLLAMRLHHLGRLHLPLLPALATFADNTAATAGGLAVGEIYRTAAGVLAIRF